MSGGGGKSGGGDYWPGFVDALTNVVIAMVFVIVVLAIALSFSAQLLAKRMAAKIADQQAELDRARVVSRAPAALVERPPSGAPVDAQAPVRTRIAVAGNETALAASATAPRMKAADRFLQLDFAPGALTLDKAATVAFALGLAPLRERLGNAPAGYRLAVVATGPEIHLSENQRAAYIRAMTVRNQLLEQGVPAARIATRIDMNVSTATPAVSVRIEETR